MSKVTLREAVARYVAELEARHSSRSHVSTVAYRLRRFARGREEVSLSAITGSEIHAYFGELAAAGLASATLAGHKQTLLAFWKFAARRRWCSARAADALRTRAHRYSFRPVRSRAANADDLATVVSCLLPFAAHRGWRPRDVRDAALVSLAVDSSRRRGELWNLSRAEAVRALAAPERLANGRTVYHAQTRGKAGPVVLRFYDESAELLERWLALLPAGATWVFVSLRTGERLRPDALHLGLLRICDYAGVRPFRFHAIRKRVVTEVIAATGDAKVGQVLAGHASERTTQMYYNEVSEAAVDQAGAALADRLRGDGLVQAFFKRR